MPNNKETAATFIMIASAKLAERASGTSQQQITHYYPDAPIKNPVVWLA